MVRAAQRGPFLWRTAPFQGTMGLTDMARAHIRKSGARQEWDGHHGESKKDEQVGPL